MTPSNHARFNTPRSYYLEFLGCRLNAAEIEDLSRRFAGAGGKVVNDPEAADVIVVNTCAVTAQAVTRSQNRLKKLHSLQPEAEIAVIGCWATEEAQNATNLPGVKWVLSNADKDHTVEVITGSKADPVPWAPGRWGHTRAFLAVQDGCDHHCTYCLTTILRGPARSRPLADAVSSAQDMVANGAQELVLTGVSLGAYGSDIALQGGLSKLIQDILKVTDVPRLRLSSIEPWDVDENLLALWEDPRLCRQLHIPLQSGSDAILRRMGRRITTDQFKLLVETARKIAPEMAITSDVIVGFPGETEDDFDKSSDFICKMAFARLHVFPYSERTGTPAHNLPNSVPQAIRKIRARKLRSLNDRLGHAYRSQLFGKTIPVLYQGTDKQGLWIGLTDTYVKVKTKSSLALYNRIVDTLIIAQSESDVIGRLV